MNKSAINSEETKALLQKIPNIYEQENEDDQIAYMKFFNPTGSGAWYITEFDKNSKDGMCFGVVDLYDVELGYFKLEQLEQTKLPFDLTIERDTSFEPTKISEINSKFQNEDEKICVDELIVSLLSKDEIRDTNKKSNKQTYKQGV